MENAVVAIGGLACGVLAGAGAQYGRLCTFAAIEDVFAGGDLRRIRAWALALAVAVGLTQSLAFLGLIDPAASPYASGRLELVGLIVGGLAFGIGMALIGTCGFGLLVRLGTGDLRALLMALVLGVAAFAATGGPLAPVRLWIGDLGTLTGIGSGGWRISAVPTNPMLRPLAAVGFTVALMVFALWHRNVRKRPRLQIAALLIGSAVAGGWYVTGVLADPFVNARLESLTFVAPIGRVLLTMMGESFRGAAFAVMSVIGVAAGSFLVAFARNEFRWEAFDDQREMRRHILGACLMGIGGVLTRGCTIGQGMSAASMLAVSAPIAVLAMMVGARLGLAYLIHVPALTSRIWMRRS